MSILRSRSKPYLHLSCIALVALSLAAGCGDDETDAGPGDASTANDGSVPTDGATGFDGSTSSAPTVVSTLPQHRATSVALGANVEVTFSDAMDGASLTTTTLTMSTGRPEVRVAGAVAYADRKATFNPSVPLAQDATYVVRITTGAKSAAGVALASSYIWSFTTGTTLPRTLAVDLGTANTFVILAKSGISTVPTAAVTGNLGVSPAAATFITGFSLTQDATNVFSTSPQVTGRVYAADYAVPTPSNLTTAVADMELAFTDAAGRAPDVTELGAGNIGGMTLTPQVYKWGTGLLIPTNVTLTGSATDVWIFQIAGDLTVSSATRVNMAGGALPENVFWQVAGRVEVGTTAHLEGIILGQTSLALRTGASINGRLLAQTAVTIDSSAVVQPAR